MSAHTPGPWEAIEGDDGDWFVQIAVQPKSFHPAFDRYRITHGWIGGDGTDNPKPELGTPEGNARLIAAAPELLELALRYASECSECNGQGFVATYKDPNDCGDCADIRAVIAKATGGDA